MRATEAILASDNGIPARPKTLSVEPTLYAPLCAGKAMFRAKEGGMMRKIVHSQPPK